MPLGMSVFCDKKSAASFHQIPWTGVDDFVGILRDLHQDVHPTKEDNKLISPSLFDPKLAAAAGDFNEFGKPRKRSRSAVVSSVGIWLDNDGGVITHQDFAALFPDLQMVIYNTFSSTAAKTKYRVWLPTTHGMSSDLYMFITGQIRAKIEDRGFRSAAWQLRWLKRELGCHMLSNDEWAALSPEKQEAIVEQIERKLPFPDHGFDWSKTMPENLMYLPCQSAAGAAASFFFDLQGGLRKPLNVEAWITHPITDNSPDPDPEPVPAPVMAPTLQLNDPMSAAMAKLCGALQAKEAQTAQANQQHRVQSAISAWRQTPNGCGQANNAFWVLGCALRKAGLTLDEVRVHLRNEANNQDRKDQINSVISSLRKQKS